MIATTPVEQIAEILVSANYRRIKTPLILAGIVFEIPAAFVGTGTSSDLILVLDTAFQTDQRIQQQVEGVARALDVVSSQRPLTTILAGPRPPSSIIDAMSRVSRILPVDVPNSLDVNIEMSNWLAVLLPLDLPQPEDATVGTLTLFADRHVADSVKDALLDASLLGTEEVKQKLSDLISEPIDSMTPGGNL